MNRTIHGGGGFLNGVKVLFITPYPTEGPSVRFRVEQYLPYLRDRGIRYSIRPFYNSYIYRVLYKKGHYLKKAVCLLLFLLRRIGDLLSAPHYDVIFIHREAYPFNGYLFEGLFRFFGRRVVYDFDDSVFLKKPLKIKRTVSASDCVIAGNDFLKSYALRYNKDVVVFPTCIDAQAYRPAARASGGNKVVIGWIGTSFTAIYLVMLKEVYAALTERFKDVEFRIIGGHFKDSDHLPLTRKDWSLDTEIRDLQEFDIGVMPLFDDDWARGKCAFKIIQYMAVGIPSVASRVGMNVEIIEDGEDGFLVNSKQEWIDRLSLLIKDKALRERMGGRGRAKAQRLYSVEFNAEKFIGLLERAGYS